MEAIDLPCGVQFEKEIVGFIPTVGGVQIRWKTKSTSLQMSKELMLEMLLIQMD